jgi:hypothetical protein
VPYIRSPRDYDGFKGILRCLFFKPPEAATAAHPLPYFSTRQYQTTTPTGVPCSFSVYVCLRWVGPLKPGQLVDLSEEETTSALEAWDREVLWPSMQDAFVGYRVYRDSQTGQPIPRLRLWRVDRSGPRPVVRTDVGGHDTVDAINARSWEWRFNNLSAWVMTVRPHEAPDEELLKMLDGTPLACHGVAMEQFLLPIPTDN